MLSNHHHQHPDISCAVSAPGKVILHGEHSVVFGKLAIAGSLGLRTRIKLNENQQQKFVIQMKPLNVDCSYNLNDFLQSITQLPVLKTASDFNIQHPELIDHEALLQQIEIFVTKYNQLNFYQKLSLTTLFYLFHAMTASIATDLQGFNLNVETDLTVGAGTGSSASFCVCLAAIFYQYVRLKTANQNNCSRQPFKPCKLDNIDLKKFTRKELDLISNWAYCAEKIIHGKPSGVDNTVCTYGSLVAYSKINGMEQLDIPLKCKILLVDTRVQKDTKVMVKRTTSLMERHEDIIEAVFDALDAVAKEALDCFKSLNAVQERKKTDSEIYERLGELTDMNQNLLATLNASHPKLDQICALMKTNGLHGKLTGAGGGGYAFALIPPHFDEKILNALVKQLDVKGFEALVTELGGPGVAVDL